MAKTAMQELIDFIKQMPAFQYEPVVHGIYNKAVELLEKEKNQIVDAYEKGIEFGSGFDDGEQFFAQTYTQQ
jgi:hypothetical protein